MTRNRLPWILILSLALILVVGLLSGTVLAQAISDPALTRFVIASGGESSRSANVTLQGTVGQAISGSAAGGPFTLESGYWSAEESQALFLPLVLK